MNLFSLEAPEQKASYEARTVRPSFSDQEPGSQIIGRSVGNYRYLGISSPTDKGQYSSR